MTYSLITPLILPFAAVSFALAYLVLKYQLLFVFETGVESGGVWWPRVFNLICFIIGFFQSITFGALVVLGARKGDARQAETKIPNLLITPLPFITVAFWLYGTFYLRTKVSRVPENIAKSISAPADSTNGNSRVALKGKIFNPAVVKILPKVWVKKNQEEELPNVYKPEFENLIDFVSKTKAPEAMASVQRQENQRHAHVQNFLRKITHRGRRTEAAVSNDTEVDLLPPEFDSL